MVFKLVEAAQKSWRRLDGHNQLPKLVLGAKFMRVASYPKLQVLLPTTEADDLPPYREQPWIVDKGEYRKVDSRTLAPAERW
jgi:hypothetical protein